MSIKEKLKPYLKDSLIWKIARNVKSFLGTVRSYTMIIGSFCLGWCSYSKMMGFFHEYGRRERIVRSWTKGPRIEPQIYNGKRIMTRDEANEFIGNAIEAGRPFMAARYGGEFDAAWKLRSNCKGFILPMSQRLKVICNNAGFFPEDKQALIKFGELMQWATSQVDLLGVFFHDMEEWTIRTYGNNPEYCRLGSLESIFSSCPWSAKLEGKKVIVIHPFAKTIQEQYKKRELLFPGRNVLPQFNLRTVKAVQTIAGNKDERFATWFDALDYMFNEAMKEDFDVAIIGCGAYGFPLAAKIKQAGKIAIHLGGATQLLFGIKGRRWEVEYKGAYPEMMNNPAWIRPSEEERPKGLETIEGGCYW